MKRSVLLFILVLLGLGSFYWLKLRVEHRKAPPGLSNSGPLIPQPTPGPSPVISPSATPPLLPAENVPSPEDQQKLKVLNQILKSRNDNDPRLDYAFNHLTPAAKILFEKKYQQIAPENRNQRGTIVYLIGRNLTSENDFKFFESVLKEPPCLSLADCHSPPPAGAKAEEGTEITLNYPQIMLLKMTERRLQAPDLDPKLRAQALNVIQSARNSSAASVARLAEQLWQTYGK